MDVHMFDFRWNNEKSSEFQASYQKKYGRKKIELNQKLSFEIKSGRTCAGSSRDNIWKPCDQLVEKKKKCDVCRSREGSFIFTSFDGFNTDIYTADDLAKISGPHLVYLALFDQQVQKVGVCKSGRKSLRQIEQGSQFTLFIAETPDGILARQIETLFRKGGLADKVLPSKKSKILVPEIQADEGKKIMENILEKNKDCLEALPDLKKYLLEKPEFFDWSEIYGLPVIQNSSKTLHYVKLEEGEAVSGIIRAIKGAFIILETKDEFVAISGKDLVGLHVDFAPLPDGLKMNSALQSALF